MRKRQTELADVDRAAARLHQHTQKYRLDQADGGPRFGLAQHLGEIAGLRLRPTTQAQSLECKEFAQRRDLDRIRIIVDAIRRRQLGLLDEPIGRALCSERVCQYVYMSVVGVSLKKKE